MARVKSRINLTLEFHGTAETPRVNAQAIADAIARFVAVDLDAAEVTAEVTSAFLNFTESYEADRDAREVSPWGNPATDASN